MLSTLRKIVGFHKDTQISESFGATRTNHQCDSLIIPDAFVEKSKLPPLEYEAHN